MSVIPKSQLTLTLPSSPSPPRDLDEALDGIESPSVSPSSPSSQPINSEKTSSSRPHRPRSMSRSHDKGGSAEQKRKRSRVTPEQLAHLERFFAADRSPTAAKRREISELLGMQERQTQIWFQNRRAKAKLFDGKQEQDFVGLPNDAPPTLIAGFDPELNVLLHEHEPILVIPCTELSIGTWRRVASTVSKYDLVSYVCDRQRTITWFIHTGVQSFKMEVPFDTIVDTKFLTAAPGMGQASFALSRPPAFFLETTDPTSPVHAKMWKRCSDWTEGMQASKVLRHDLVGAAIQLAHVLRLIAATTVGPGVALYHPSHHMDALCSPSTLPSSSGLVGIMGEPHAGPSQQIQFGYSSPPQRLPRPSLMYADSAQAFSATTSPSSMTSTPYLSPSSSSGGSSFSSPMYGNFPPSSNGSPALHYTDHPRRSSPDDTQQLAISHIVSRRSLADIHSPSHIPFASSSGPTGWSESRRPSSSSDSSHSVYQNPPESGKAYYPSS